MEPTTILGITLSVAVSAISFLYQIGADARREKREAVDRFAKRAYEFCRNIAGWYSRIINVTNSILISGRAGTLDEVRTNYYKQRITQVMTDDVYWTAVHSSLADLKSSVEEISSEGKSKGMIKFDEMENVFLSFKNRVLNHKTEIHNLLWDWITMDAETRKERLDELEVERVKIEEYKDKLIELTEKIKGLFM